MPYKRLSVGTAVLMAVSLILSACATSTPEKIEIVATATPEPAVGAPECECGFDVIIGQNGDTVSVNPILARDLDGFWRTHMLFDSLIHLDPMTIEPLPHLAQSWEISEDRTTYTFHLVDADVRWHDGEPFTVEDIEFTVMEILKPSYTGVLQQRFADLVGADKVIAGEATSLEGFKIIDAKTVQFKLNKPNAPFLATAIFDLKFLPQHLLEGKEITDDLPYNQSPTGTGPYKLKEWDKGNHMVLEWNPDYWGEKPCARTITSLVIPDMQAIAAALEAGDIHTTLMAPPTEVPRLAKVEGLTFYKQPPIAAETLWFNLDHPILQDSRVRQAIAQAIDVRGFTEGVLQGATDPANAHITSASWAWNPDAKLPEYNPEAAKALLAEAGYAGGFRIKLACNQGNFFREHFVEFAQAELAKLGIEVEVEKIEWTTFYGNALQRNFEMMIMNGPIAVADPGATYDYFHTGGPNNYSNYSNPEVDRLLEQARVMPDLESRKPLYYQITALVNQDLPSLPVFWRPNPMLAQARFKNVVPSALHTYGDIHTWCQSP